MAKYPEVSATTHIAASTEDVQKAAAITMANIIIDILLEQPSSQNPLSLRIVELKKDIEYEIVDSKRVDRQKKRL
jgi:phosphoglycerate dehydrogenase-like enzyme